MTYNATSQTSLGLIFGSPFFPQLGIIEKTVDEIFGYLTLASPVIAMPMLLPVMIKELMARAWNDRVGILHEELFNVELATKMRKGMADVPYEALNLGAPLNLDSIDLIDITRSLNSVSTLLAYSSMQCRSSLQHLNFVAGINKEFQAQVALGGNRDLELMQISLVAKLEHLQSWLEGIEGRCFYLTQRAQAQVQTVSSR